MFFYMNSGDWKANLIKANKVDEIEWKQNRMDRLIEWKEQNKDKLFIHLVTDYRQ